MRPKPNLWLSHKINLPNNRKKLCERTKCCCSVRARGILCTCARKQLSSAVRQRLEIHDCPSSILLLGIPQCLCVCSVHLIIAIKIGYNKIHDFIYIAFKVLFMIAKSLFVSCLCFSLSRLHYLFHSLYLHLASFQLLYLYLYLLSLSPHAPLTAMFIYPPSPKSTCHSPL